MTCDEYDYIEIACMFGLEVVLQYRDSEIAGKAKDTRRGPEGEEGMVLLREGAEQWCPLEPLQAMTAVTPNPHFKRVEFSATFSATNACSLL